MMRRTLGNVVGTRNWTRIRTWETTALRGGLVGEEGEKRVSTEICGSVEQEPGIAAAGTRGAGGTAVGETQSRESRRRDLPAEISVPDLIAATACLSVRLRT